MFIITDDLNTVDHDEILKWVGPLKAERFGAIVTIEAKNLNELNLMLNYYQPAFAIILSSLLTQQLCESNDVDYTIRSNVNIFYSGHILMLPDCHNLDWGRTEPALDRFEELL